jgi:hypothetical protein
MNGYHAASGHTTVAPRGGTTTYRSPNGDANLLTARPGDARAVEGAVTTGFRSVSRRLGRLIGLRWDRVWLVASVLFVGAALGSLDAFLSIDHRSHSQTVRGMTAVVFTLVFAMACALASLTVKAQRHDSVREIKDDLDAMISVTDPSAT